MKIHQLGLLLMISSFSYAKNVDFKLEAVPLEQQNFEQFIQRYFSNMNISVSEKKGVVYIGHIEPKQPKVIKRSFVYSPIHRDVDYLASFLKDGTEGNQVFASGDKLVYYGTSEDIARVKSILKSIDTKSREVVVTGYVFEVQNIEKEGSGINLLAKLLSGKLGISVGYKQSYENFITVNAGNLDAMFELFRTDQRFRVVSSPTLRVKSGSRGNFSVGSDVPVLSNVTYQDGRPIQSIEYRSSGVIFDIQPTIKDKAIDLKIQQLSNFIKTDTGVNNSPTLVKRDLVTDVTVKSGDVIVLGGLAENKISNGETSFSLLPKGWLSGKSNENTKTDIIVLLQVKEI
ncbi:type II secretion system protein GspD [Mannheimia haemolytica]|uniref:type II secretion system protein GspD n=1 Tax=Mannheimia haemolytica TaxID=75985 RepID=UPI0038F81AA0